MTWATYTMLWVSGMGLLASIGALFAAAHLLRRYRSTSSAALSQRLSELEAMVESLTAQLRSIRARLNMQAYRQRLREAPRPESTEPIDPERQAAETRAELNSQLARKLTGGA